MKWPDCHFTQRSGGFNLVGPVHTVLDIHRDLAPDPRTRGKSNPDPPKLAISTPAMWVAFSLSGEVIENAGGLSSSGKPLNVYRETSKILDQAWPLSDLFGSLPSKLAIVGEG